MIIIVIFFNFTANNRSDDNEYIYCKCNIKAVNSTTVTVIYYNIQGDVKKRISKSSQKTFFEANN